MIFNPLLARTAADVFFNAFVYQSILYVDSDLSIGTRLAASYQVIDQTRIDVCLRDDVKWHDHSQLTIDDLIYSILITLDPSFPNPERFSAIKGAERFHAGQCTSVEGLTRKGEFELSIELSREAPSFLQSLLLAIIPKHIYAGTNVKDLHNHPANRQPIGCGPYRLERVQPDIVSYKRFDDYFLGQPHFERMDVLIADQDTTMTLAQQGDIDYAYIRPQDVEQVKNYGYHTYEFPSLNYQFIGINHRHLLLSDKRVRQALMYGINRQRLVDTLLLKHGQVINSHFVPLVWAFDESTLNPYLYNPSKARSLLVDAGVTEGLRLTLGCPSGNSLRERVAELIAEDLKRVGVTLEVKVLPFPEFYAARNEQALDLWLLIWNVSLDPDPSQYFLSTSPFLTPTSWVSEESDALIREAASISENSRRRSLYRRWTEYINEELPHLFLFNQTEIQLVHPRLKGLKPDPRGALWNIHEIYSE